MRLAPTALVLLPLSLLLLACSGDPVGPTGGGGAGGGGSGGGGSCVVAECPAGNECQEAACVNGACGFADKPDDTACGVDGALACKGGQCQGCATGEQCSTAVCANGVCCDTPCDGACVACTNDLTGQPDGVCALKLPEAPSPECDSKGGCGMVPGFCLCEDGVKDGDESDVDCGGICGASCGDGATCSAVQDCVSSLCVDGVCCNAVCDGPCVACNLATAPGLCTPVAPSTTDVLCSANQVCDGLGTCSGAAGQSCTMGSECASHLCAGNPTACADCVADADCGGERVCIGGACFDKAEPGAACQDGKGCSSGFCVDGVCCSTECTGLCMACHFNLTVVESGTCAPVIGPAQGFNAQYDPHNDCADAPGGGSACSGAPADAEGNSSCGGSD